MLVEYRCACGFRSIFRYKYQDHAASCHLLRERKNGGRSGSPEDREMRDAP